MSVGGVYVGGHQTGSAIVDLVPGSYGVANAYGGTPLIRYFTVVPAVRAVGHPKAAATVRLYDMGFGGLPRALPAGQATLKVANTGRSPHHMLFGRLHPGRTAADFVRWSRTFAGQPPADLEGDMDLLSPGAGAWMTVRFRPGRYIAVSLVPDPKTHLLQVQLGMLASFTVR